MIFLVPQKVWMLVTPPYCSSHPKSLKKGGRSPTLQEEQYDSSSPDLYLSSSNNTQFLINQIKFLQKQLAAKQSPEREPRANSWPPPSAITSCRSGKAPPPSPSHQLCSPPNPQRDSRNDSHRRHQRECCSNSRKREHRSRHSHRSRSCSHHKERSSRRNRSPSEASSLSSRSASSVSACFSPCAPSSLHSSPHPGPLGMNYPQSTDSQPIAKVAPLGQTLTPQIHTPREASRDPLDKLYYLPVGARCHPGSAPELVTIEWGCHKYYDFFLHSDFPMAIKPTGLSQLKYYRDFLESCTQTPPVETEVSASALFLASQPLFQSPLFEEQGITLSIQPPMLISTGPFAYIRDDLLPLITKWLKPAPSELKFDFLAHLPIDSKIKSSLAEKRNPSFPPLPWQISCDSDPLLAFLHTPLPLKTTDMVKGEEEVILFVEPHLDTLTRYADFRHQCLVELTNFLILDCVSTAAKKISRDTTVGPMRPVLGGLSGALGALRLAAQLRLKHLLKTTLFLHLKLRQEALQMQRSSSFRTFLMDAEPIIDSRLLPQEATAIILDTFRDEAINTEKLTVSKSLSHNPKFPSKCKSEKQGKGRKSSFKNSQHNSAKKHTSQALQASTSHSFRSDSKQQSNRGITFKPSPYKNYRYSSSTYQQHNGAKKWNPRVLTVLEKKIALPLPISVLH